MDRFDELNDAARKSLELGEKALASGYHNLALRQIAIAEQLLSQAINSIVNDPEVYEN